MKLNSAAALVFLIASLDQNHGVHAFRCTTRWTPDLHGHAIDRTVSDAITRNGCMRMFPRNPERLFYSGNGWCCGITQQEGNLGQATLVEYCANALDKSRSTYDHEDPYLCNCGTAAKMVCQPKRPAYFEQ
ncbi:hypothetical protein EJ03DRAFT_325961 [Teratosphaeria nubilosa]|uniref:Cyanovirin-N domain-containing protein n=1 Tax=Teratosphaeria nubilosa TaxID=161662 RepID=A0A6G1LFF6_9PEZI|nr:hypothetical protein EJ03DRAFT_325961 [Teratosphaeria nubilosa]